MAIKVIFKRALGSSITGSIVAQSAVDFFRFRAQDPAMRLAATIASKTEIYGMDFVDPCRL